MIFMVREQKNESIHFNNSGQDGDDISKIPATTEVLALTSKQQHNIRLLKQICNYKVFTVYHQNICGLVNKVNELITFLYPTLPHVYYRASFKAPPN